MALVASGLFQMRAGPPCISVLRFGMSTELRSQSTPQHTTCLMALGTERLFAAGESHTGRIADFSNTFTYYYLQILLNERVPIPHLWPTGEGGSVQQWRCCEAQCSFEELPALPAAKYGNIEFPNIAQLAPAGPDCVLACSSTGSVALWNHARSLPPAPPSALCFRMHQNLIIGYTDASSSLSHVCM